MTTNVDHAQLGFVQQVRTHRGGGEAKCVWYAYGGGGRPLRTRGGGGAGGRGGGARLDWVVGACVGAACMAEKRAKIGRVSVENQPVFGNNTHLGALSAVVTRQIRSGTLH